MTAICAPVIFFIFLIIQYDTDLGYISSVQSLSHVRPFATPWTAARQASLSITNSWSPPKPISIVLVMPSNHLILCHPLLLLPSFFPSIRVFSIGQLSTSGGQSIGVSASKSVPPVNTQEKAMAPHSSTLAWKIPWMEEPGRLQSMGSLRVGHDWATSLSLFTFIHWRRKWQPTPVFLPGESQRQWAPVYGVAQSRTGLKRLSSSSSSSHNWSDRGFSVTLSFVQAEKVCHLGVCSWGEIKLQSRIIVRSFW